MSGKLPLVLVASLALVSLAAAHSIEKRQTTVTTTNSDNGEVQRTDGLLYLIEASLFAAGVVLVILLISSFFQIFLSGIFPAIGLRSAQRQEEDPSLLSNFLSSLDNRLDIVDAGFNYMEIENEACRMKTICELEAYAVSHPLASLAINTINSSLRGLERYQTAIEAGMNGADCALIYDQCTVSYVGF